MAAAFDMSSWRTILEPGRAISYEHARRCWGDELERRVRGGVVSTGLVNEMIHYQIASGGKRLRALLPVWVCVNLGGRAEDALDFGAGLELLHNATLVHDDLQDGDLYRRGVSTVWHRWGAAQAVNAGDALIFEGLAAIARAPSKAGFASAACEALLRVIEGQAMEFQLKLPPGDPAALSPTIEVWQAMAQRKTGALFSACLRAGALAAGADPATVEGCAEHGERLGLLFQVQDDYLDLVGKKGRQHRGSDLMEGKLSFPVIWAYQNAAAAEVTALRAVVEGGRERTSVEMVEEAIHLLERTGALAATALWLKDSLDTAVAHPMAAVVPGLADLFVAPVAHALPGPESGTRHAVSAAPRGTSRLGETQ